MTLLGCEGCTERLESRHAAIRRLVEVSKRINEAARTGNPALVAGLRSESEALRDQLGLKLESQTGSASVVVIDHIQEPSPN